MIFRAIMLGRRHGFRIVVRLAQAVETALSDVFLGPGNGVALAVQEPADEAQGLETLLVVVAMLGTRMARAEEGKLSLPEAQNVGFDANQACGLANLYLTFRAISRDRLWRGSGFFWLRRWMRSRHADDFSPLPTRSLRT